ncbi:MAG: cation:proton antiporter [Myxococcales bacterium]|nr:cation:proton antiporter [Myxococcales bacterium]
MSTLAAGDVTVVLLAIAALLGTARLLGELARRLHQPAVLGELLAGVLLGPTVLGALAPDAQSYLFPASGPVPIVLSGFATVAVVLFLLVAGMEVDLSTVWKQGRSALGVSLLGLAVPFGLGFVLARLAPGAMGMEPDADPTIFALFFATALGISALPVIVKTLMDLNLLRSDLGMVVVAAAIVQDLAGWMIFAIVLGLMGGSGEALPVGYTVLLTLVFAVGMLTVGRWAINKALPWLQAFASWPGGVLGFTATVALLCAAFTERIGIHAIFGAFVFGVALGDSRHLRDRTRATLEQFVSFVFAPVFFASIGLHVNFVRHFDATLVFTVLGVGSVGKVLGAGLGARLGGMPTRQAWAVGFAMNARGAMEIILGVLALQLGIIRERMFVALVVLALATSLMSGPLLQRILRLRKARRFVDYLHPKAFVHRLAGTTPEAAIRELSLVLAGALGRDADTIAAAVLEREAMMPTGLELGLAVPHARIAEVSAPAIAVGLSEHGVSFETVDGSSVTVVILVLTPPGADEAQLEILADIARTLRIDSVRASIATVGTLTEFLATIRTAPLAHLPATRS